MGWEEVAKGRRTGSTVLGWENAEEEADIHTLTGRVKAVRSRKNNWDGRMVRNSIFTL